MVVTARQPSPAALVLGEVQAGEESMKACQKPCEHIVGGTLGSMIAGVASDPREITCFQEWRVTNCSEARAFDDGV